MKEPEFRLGMSRVNSRPRRSLRERVLGWFQKQAPEHEYMTLPRAPRAVLRGHALAGDSRSEPRKNR